MKNPFIVFSVIAVVAVVWFGGCTRSQNSATSESVLQNDTQNAMEKTEAPEQEAMEKKVGEAMMQKADDTMLADSRYVEYSTGALEKAATNRRVIFFYASWCPTCAPADASFTQNVRKIPEDLVVVRVNYNDPDTDQEEKDLAKKYGITYQHTFVQIDSTGKEVTKWNGGQIDELLSNIE